MKKELFAVDKNDNVKHWTVETNGAEIIVCHGRYLGKMQKKVTVCKAKNVGRANETTPAEQAILEAEAKYTKQIDKCYRATIEEARRVGQVLPMLAHNFLDHGHRISFPCYVSAKLDGVRCVATVDGDNVTLTSRGGKEYPCPEFIHDELVNLSYLTGINKFDGELYIHGTKLQHIVSAVKKPNDLTPKLKYHIFDLPNTDKWEDRWLKLKEIKTKHRLDHMEIVDCIKVENKLSAEMMLHKYMSQGYEGLMLRNLDGKYEYNHRSADLQKWKIMQDLEAKVLNVVEDKNGEGVLTCLMAGSKDKTFDVKMRGTHEERLFANQKKLVGKWIVVIYQALTEAGLPQFPVGSHVRECDEKGNPID